MCESRTGKSVVLPEDVTCKDCGVSLLGYQRAVRETDHLPQNDLRTPILGLFGEVGSLLSVVKKKRRDTEAYASYDDAILEELGDVLWYFTCLVNRAGLDLSTVGKRVFRDGDDWTEVQAEECRTWGNIQARTPTAENEDLFLAMCLLARLTGDLVGALRAEKSESCCDGFTGELVAVLQALTVTAAAADAALDLVARRNLEKIFSRYPREYTYSPLADGDLPPHERLPRRFELFIGEHEVNGKTYVLQTCNGVIIGDRLTDNRKQQDDYRFHDVFHVAYAVHLSWSPILRGLFKVKRKSRPTVDENEDGARACLIEEGIATFVFGRAVERNFFEKLERLDFDLLKLVKEFTRGFEVERCALWQWERAILEGFKVFRELRTHRRGWVVADLEAHTIEFKPADVDVQGHGFGSAVTVRLS